MKIVYDIRRTKFFKENYNNRIDGLKVRPVTLYFQGLAAVIGMEFSTSTCKIVIEPTLRNGEFFAIQKYPGKLFEGFDGYGL